jgi:hypothetical protein
VAKRKNKKKTPVSVRKARKILRHGEVRGEPLTEKQKGLFGLIAGGGTPTRTKAKKRRKR